MSKAPCRCFFIKIKEVILERFIKNKNKKILFITGAGASQESGLPTFRDPLTGYWKKYNPHEIASVKALENNTIEFNQFYNQRRKQLKHIEPNYFHEFIKLQEDIYGEDSVAVITTNIDDLHEKTNIKNIFKIHGNLKEIVNFEGEVKNIGYNELVGDDLLSCRPNVVLFGEGSYIINNKQVMPYSVMEKITNSLKKDDLVFIVGTSSVVVDFPLLLSYNINNPKVFIVNPNISENECVLTGRESVIKKKACDSVPYIEDIILKNIKNK